MTDPRPTPPERVPVEVVRWRELKSLPAGEVIADGAIISAGDALAAALEATAAERDALAAMLERAQGTLRDVSGLCLIGDVEAIARLARERLERP